MTRPRSASSSPRADRSAAARGTGASANLTQRIADSITTAIVEHRLMPGTKLAEQRIADVFNVSRTLVRQALMQLSRDKLITLEPSRGARVAEPSINEARQVFDARKTLEGAVIQRAAHEFTAAQFAELRAHLQAQTDAVQRTDITHRTRLLAEFHVIIAQMLGNDVLAGILSDLVSRCSLITLMYQSAHSAEHSLDEHVAIVEALERRDAPGAARLMHSHLHNVERNLQWDPRAPDLGAVLLPAAAAHGAAAPLHSKTPTP